MKKIFLIIIFLLHSAHAYLDSDFDGVDDANDKCQDTPFTELVDINGCSVLSLRSPHNFNIMMGVSYSDSDYQTLDKTDIFSSTIQINYFYKNFSLQASSSYFSTESNEYSDNGLNDSFLGTAYQFELLPSLLLRVGVGVFLPTYKTSLNNNHTDYLSSLNLSYNVENINLFGGFSHTLVKDADTADLEYQNSSAYSLGMGKYIANDLYVSGAYNMSDSIYTHIEKIQTLSAYIYYVLDEDYFTTFSYSYGLSSSASNNYMSINLGYTF